MRTFHMFYFFYDYANTFLLTVLPDFINICLRCAGSRFSFERYSSILHTFPFFQPSIHTQVLIPSLDHFYINLYFTQFRSQIPFTRLPTLGPRYILNHIK